MSNDPMAEDSLDEILNKFFIMRAATPDDNLEELKLRNELGEPSHELKAAINAYTTNKIILELEDLVMAGNEFGAKSGSIEAGWAHIRDRLQTRLQELRHE